MSEQGTTLYDRIGGRDTVAGMISSFYNRVLADPELAPFFVGRDLEKLAHMQQEFFSAALGGPIQYSGRPVIHAHHGMGVGRGHFQRFAEHLLSTLTVLGIDEEDRYQIIARINTYMDDVVTMGSGVGA